MLVSAESRPAADTAPTRLALAWQRALSFSVGTFYYRTQLLGARSRLSGPVLFVALHRNGAVDGWVHQHALGGSVVFLVAANLKRKLLSRAFAVGIPVVRASDGGDRSANQVALAAAADVVRTGGRILIYPEGTSTLGPRPLRFGSGAARIALDLARTGAAFRVVPLGIDYASPASPGSDVDVIVGTDIDISDIDPFGPDAAGVFHDAIARGLEDLAIVFRDDQAQEVARAACEGIDSPPGARLEALRAIVADPGYRPRLGIVRRAGIARMVGVTLNAPLVYACGWAGRRLSDGPNVVALHRILAGFYLLPAWLASTFLICLWAFGPIAAASIAAAQVGSGALALRNVGAFRGRRPT